ncbi:MAG: MATE family efflux transporter [Pseudomonadota bacterium]
MSRSPEKSLTDGPIRNRLFDLWLPMIGGVLAVKAIGLSDAYFVGQLGENQLAAISFTFPVVMTLISLAIGLSSGASSVLSQAIGEADDKADRCAIVAGALSIGAVFAVFILALGVALVDPLFRIMGADGAILAEVRSYMLIWFFGAALLILPIVINGILRATGDGAAPALLMTGVAILNIAINPIFIFGWGPVPALEIQGAATATLIARGASLIAAVALLLRRELIVFSFDVWKRGFQQWPEILRIAGPAAGSTAMNPLAMGVATAAVASLGDAAVAGFGVATKVQSIALVPLLALSAATAPLAGQNSAAGETERTRRALYWCAGIAGAWSIIVALFFWGFADALAAAFTESDGARETAALYLMIAPLTFAGYGLVVAVSAAMNGLGRSITAFGLAGGRAMALLAPGAWIGVSLGGFAGVAGAVAGANILSGAAAVALTRFHSLTTRRNGDTADYGGREESE